MTGLLRYSLLLGILGGYTACLPAVARDSFIEPCSNDIKAMMAGRVDQSGMCMVIGLIGEHGSRVFSAGKLSNGTEVDGNTIFEIGSVTKVFTALLLMDAARRGEMKLDDPVAKYLPERVEVPTYEGKEITLLDLAAQESGLPFDAGYVLDADGKRLEGAALWRSFNQFTADDLYEFLGDYRLNVAPGERFQYSNVGMSLLGHAIERNTRTDYESLVVNRICRPLKMDSTQITLTAKQKALLPIGHGKDGQPIDPIDFQVLAPTGALRSTANDLLKFLAANLGLNKTDFAPLLAQMQTIRHTSSPDFGNSAMPWCDNAVYNPPGFELLGHAGATAGFSAFIGIDKKKRRGVVVLLNQRTTSAGGFGWAILQELPLDWECGRRLVREVVGLGIALEVDDRTELPRINSVWPKSPAGLAGLRRGQTITKINGRGIEGKNLDECLGAMAGEVGTIVQLELSNPKSGVLKQVELTIQKFLTLPIESRKPTRK